MMEGPRFTTERPAMRYVDHDHPAYIEGEDQWEVRECIQFISSKGRVIDVEVTFITDFASVPRFLWWVLPPWGKYGRSAVVHDKIYRTPKINIPRQEADEIFKEAMQCDKVEKWKIFVMHSGVRVGGKKSYQPRSE